MQIKLEDKKMDEIIKIHLKNTNGLGLYEIRPSSDFTRNVMKKIESVENFQKLTSKLTIVVLSMLPFSLRMIWNYVRADYFSLSSMPLGGYLYEIYHVFMTSMAAYSMLALGLMAIFFFTNKGRIINNLLSRS